MSKKNKNNGHSKYRREVYAKTENQQILLDSIRDNRVIFTTGPAGSGKTHLAIGAAINTILNDDNLDRLIVTRPVVSVDENLGHLPGDENEKIHPYMVAALDEIYKFLDFSDVGTWRNNVITNRSPQLEIIPLGFMRGRNFHRCIVVADEMQNASRNQLKMLLTRIGKHSKMILTGDLSQSDLNGKTCLNDFIKCLDDVNEISHCRLGAEDIIRDDLVKLISQRLSQI